MEMRIVVVLLVGMLAGCSYMTVKEAPQRISWRTADLQECSDNSASYILDGAVGGGLTGYGIGTLMGVGSGGVIPLVTGTGYLLSMGYGTEQDLICKEYQYYKLSQVEERLSDRASRSLQSDYERLQLRRINGNMTDAQYTASLASLLKRYSSIAVAEGGLK
jgi:hypothetical protein